MVKLTTAFLACMCAAPSWAQVDFTSLGAEMTDVRAVSQWPEHAYDCRQFSSYDRASVSPDDSATWFANADVNQFIRIDETPIAGGVRKEWVMADASGPGAIVRIWSPNPKGVLRIYLDHGQAPTIEAPMEALLAGKDFVGSPLAQSQSRGWNLYLPVPYAEHVRITTDSPGSYYQVNYRTYERGTKVATLTRSQLELSKGIIADWNKRLAAGSVPGPDLSKSPYITLEPGGSCTSGVEAGGGALTSLAVAVRAKDIGAALRSVVLVAEFDGEQTIWCPVGDFFGAGTGPSLVQDWYRTSKSAEQMSCRFVMPFKNTAKLWLRNVGGAPAEVKIDWKADALAWTDRSMHFGAAWHCEPNIKTRAAAGTEDWNFISATGKGVLVGDNLAVFNPVGAWWGEGDEKIYVDGEKFPSHFGTGTEDYYGYGWCDQVPFLHPFHGQMRCDGYREGGQSTNRGNTFVSRLRSLDAIPFTRELRFDMEVWHWAECEVDYAATVYYYALPGATTNRRPQPEFAARAPREVPPPFKLANAVECESARITARSQGLATEAQGLSGLGAGDWSGESHLWVKGRAKGDFVELTLDAAQDGPVRVRVFATRSWDYGVVRFTVNGESAGDDTDLFSGKAGLVSPTGAIDLGVHTPRDGKFVLRAEVVGGNPASQGTRSYFGLDCVTLSAP